MLHAIRRMLLAGSLALLVMVVGCASSESREDSGPPDAGGGLLSDGGEMNLPHESPALVAQVCPSAEVSSVFRSTGEHIVKTTHYDLIAYAKSTDEAEEMGRLLEAGYAGLQSYFGGAPTLGPDERLAVKFFADAATYNDGLPPDGASAKGESGGYYSYVTKTAYTFRQGNAYAAKMLLLHEATHQFQHLTRGTAVTLPFWYLEGIAEDLSRHEWDGACVRMGVVPLLSWEDLAQKALDEVQAPGFSVATVVSDPNFKSRQVSWALHRFLELGDEGAHRDAFHQLGAALEAGASDPAQAFQEFLGDPAALTEPLKRWLLTAQEPMQPIFVEWLPAGPRDLVGDSSIAFSAALVQGPVTRFTFDYDASEAQYWAVGTMLGYLDDSNFEALLLTSNGTLHSFISVEGSSTWGPTSSIPESVWPSSTGTIAIDFSGGGQRVTINGVSMDFFSALPARGGVVVNSTRAAFHHIAWQE